MLGMRSRRAGPKADLEGRASSWADGLSDLLNHTITDGIRLGAVVRRDGLCTVARGVTKTSLTPRVIPLTISQAPPRCYLYAAWTLDIDRESDRLTVTKSKIALRTDDGDGAEDVFSYEYGLDPDNEYPEAHLHVAGESPLLDELCDQIGTSTRLRDLHFPVGGRRFRPSLEDVIEMLVTERFVKARVVKARDGWREVVEESRREFQAGQLRAAVRQDPETARAELAALDPLTSA